MYKHVALFKSKNPEAIKQICQHIMIIKEEISGLLSVSYHENLTDSAQGYNQMAIMGFRERADAANWRNHSYHQEVVKQLNEIADTLFFDYQE